MLPWSPTLGAMAGQRDTVELRSPQAGPGGSPDPDPTEKPGSVPLSGPQEGDSHAHRRPGHCPAPPTFPTVGAKEGTWVWTSPVQLGSPEVSRQQGM